MRRPTSTDALDRLTYFNIGEANYLRPVFGQGGAAALTGAIASLAASGLRATISFTFSRVPGWAFVEWNDGVVDAIPPEMLASRGGTLTHTYATAGDYNVLLTAEGQGMGSQALGVTQFEVAADFDSTNYLYVTGNSSLALSGGGGATIGAWVRIDNKAGGSQAMFHRWDGSGFSLELLGGYLHFFASTDGGLLDRYANFCEGQWYFAVGTVDAEASHLYLNGGSVDFNSGGQVTDPATTVPVVIGGRSDPATGQFDGQVRSAFIYNRALSDSEVAALYNNGIPLIYADLGDPQKSGLVSWWNLDEASGTRADSAGTNHLTSSAAGHARYFIDGFDRDGAIGNGWQDVLGGVWSMGEGFLVGNTADEQGYFTTFLRRGQGENATDESVNVIFGYGADFDQGFIGAVARYQESTGDHYLSHLSNTTLFLYKVAGGAVNLLGSTTYTRDSDDHYALTLTVSGTSPTTVTAVVSDLDTGQTRGTVSVSDGEESLQTSGSFCVSVWKGAGATVAVSVDKIELLNTA